MLTEHVEEYPEEREKIPDHKPYIDRYVVVAGDQAFDLDPTAGVARHGRVDLTQGNEPRRCGVPGCDSPITPLSDYGYYCWSCYGELNDKNLAIRDFVHEDDEGDPEWVPLCWPHARPIYYAESGVVDPQTGRKATDWLESSNE